MPAFCQLLVAEGYNLLYISSHGQDEAGKDIIAVNPDGKLEAYQLKDGNVNLPEFRKIRGELEELLKHPIIHPSVKKGASFTSYLVVNGRIGDPVRSRISQENDVNWGHPKAAKLKYFQREELIIRFAKQVSSCLPTEPKDFKDFLEIYMGNGADLFPQKVFCEFLDQHFRALSLGEKSQKNMASLVSSAIILTNYLVTPWVVKGNYVAQMEAWVCLSAYIYFVIEKHGLRTKFWKQSNQIIEQIIEDIFYKLLEELRVRKHLIEGDWPTDNIVYGVRTSIILGYICTYALYRRLVGDRLSQQLEQEILEFNKSYEDKMRFCGEVMTSHFLAYYWFNLLMGRYKEATGRLAVVLKGLVSPKTAPQPFGYPNPYYGYEDSIRIVNEIMDEDHDESFVGQPYTMWSLVQTLARHGDRPILSHLWPSITRTQYLEIVPEDVSELFKWKIDNGDLIEKFPNVTESWLSLQNTALDEVYDRLPKSLVSNPGFAILFLQVFPHRVTPQIVKLVDKAIFTQSNGDARGQIEASS